MYLFTYFKEDAEKAFIAESEDGLCWRERNGGEPVFTASVGTGQLRDPFLYQDDAGAFHLLWTDGWRSRSIGYARSNDLIQWEEEKLIPLMAHLPETQNTWAPELFYDTAAGGCRIVWSSTVGDGPRNHRIWSSVTRDFQTFTEAKLFFDPGYNVIDACITDLGDRYFMLFKDERGENRKDTAYKAIRSAVFGKEGGDRPEMREISELLTPPLTEGPTLYAIDRDGAREWIMLVDGFQEHYYTAFRSRDLSVWAKADDVKLPKGIRHGAVLRLKDAADATR